MYVIIQSAKHPEHYIKLAEGHGVARRNFCIFLVYYTPDHPRKSTKNFSPFGPTVWLAIGSI